jgi:hypothetical protein
MMRVTGSGVGIGTTSPNDALEIMSDSAWNTFYASRSGTNQYIAMGIEDGSSNTMVQYGAGSNTINTGIMGSNGEYFVDLHPNSSGGSMEIINGDVGIGATAPNGKLDIQGLGGANGNGGAAWLYVEAFSSSYADWEGAPHILLGKSHSNSLGTYSTTQNGETIGQIVWQGVDATNAIQADAQITVSQNGTAGTGAWNTPTSMQFGLGSASGLVTPMTILSSGNIGIGTTNPASSLDLSQETDALALPVGTSGQRPTGVNGMTRYNSTIGAIEGYINGAWATLLSGTPALPNGTTATTQSSSDNSTKVATTAFVQSQTFGFSSFMQDCIQLTQTERQEVHERLLPQPRQLHREANQSCGVPHINANKINGFSQRFLSPQTVGFDGQVATLHALFGGDAAHPLLGQQRPQSGWFDGLVEDMNLLGTRKCSYPRAAVGGNQDRRQLAELRPQRHDRIKAIALVGVVVDQETIESYVGVTDDLPRAL